MSKVADTGLVPRFFVAYTQRDQVVARHVRNLLQNEMGFEVHSMDDNPDGTDFVEEGRRKLAWCTCLVPIIGEERSTFLNQEVHDAFEQKKDVLPIVACPRDREAWPNRVDQHRVCLHILEPSPSDAARLVRSLFQLDVLRHGIVPRALLTLSKSFVENPFTGYEQFAAELVELPLRIERSRGELRVAVNRHPKDSCRYVVLSNAGKKALQKVFVHPRRAEVQAVESRLAALLDAASAQSDGAESVTLPAGLPMRWASGGMLPIVTFRKRRWVAMLFRDIAPYGWNLPLGASERYFGGTTAIGDATDCWEDELRRPERLVAREFIEEMLVLNRTPGGAGLRVRRFRFLHELLAPVQKRCEEFSSQHIDLRNSTDLLAIPAQGDADIPVHEVQVGNCEVSMLENRRESRLHAFLVSVNPSEMGVEMVLPVTFALGDDDCLLDGEIISWGGHFELVRMPIALLSVEYLRRVFDPGRPLHFVDVPLPGDDPLYSPDSRAPSVAVPEPLSATDVHLFDWDVRRRREIAREVAGGDPNTELGRHQRWVRLFGACFDGKPASLPTWFTPTAAKTVRLAIGAGLL